MTCLVRGAWAGKWAGKWAGLAGEHVPEISYKVKKRKFRVYCILYSRILVRENIFLCDFDMSG
jgi:hypothetical protein